MIYPCIILVILHVYKSTIGQDRIYMQYKRNIVIYHFGKSKKTNIIIDNIDNIRTDIKITYLAV